VILGYCTGKTGKNVKYHYCILTMGSYTIKQVKIGKIMLPCSYTGLLKQQKQVNMQKSNWSPTVW